LVDLQELAARHAGELVWVLGSGPSLNYVDAGLFADQTVVATNFAAESLAFEADYVFSHYHHVVAQLLPSDVTTFVTLERDTLSHKPWRGHIPDNVAFAKQDSYSAPGGAWNPLTTHKPKKGTLAYGSSSLHGAMHLAAHLGASHIMLVGADCGTIDGAHRVDTYRVKNGHTPWALYNEHHQLMKQYLQETYGAKVHSLNPFINLNLEGHTFGGV